MRMTSPGLGFQAAVTSRAAPRYGEMVGTAFLYSVLVGGRGTFSDCGGRGDSRWNTCRKTYKANEWQWYFFLNRQILISAPRLEAELAPKREVPPGEATALEALLRGDGVLEKKNNLCKEEETLLEIQVAS